MPLLLASSTSQADIPFQDYLLAWQATYLTNFNGKQVMLGDHGRNGSQDLYVASNFDGRVIILDGANRFQTGYGYPLLRRCDAGMA